MLKGYRGLYISVKPRAFASRTKLLLFMMVVAYATFLLSKGHCSQGLRKSRIDSLRASARLSNSIASGRVALACAGRSG